MAALLTDDARFIDARGDWIAGRGDIMEAGRRLFDLAPDLHIEFDRLTPHGPYVLLRGTTHSSIEMLNQRTLWRALVEGERVKVVQSFTGGNPPALARILMGERARSEAYGDLA